MQVLTRLVADPGLVVSRAELLDTIWGGAFVGDDAVSAAVIKLRRAFENSARSPRVIETVHKSGYRLIAMVSPGERVSASATDDHARTAHPRVKVASLLRCAYRVDPDQSLSMGPEEWQRSTAAISGAIDTVIKLHDGVPIHEIRAITASGTDHSAVLLAYHWRIGVASGEILSSASPTSSALTVHGAPLEQVNSLTIAATSGGILADETRILAQGLVGVHRCDPSPTQIDIRGVRYLDAEAGWSTPWEARAERGLTPLFGRNQTVRRVGELLDDATVYDHPEFPHHLDCATGVSFGFVNIALLQRNKAPKDQSLRVGLVDAVPKPDLITLLDQAAGPI
jgi:hypothetical protein